MSLRLRRSREDVQASSIARHWRTLCLVAAGLILLAGSRAGAGTGIVQSPTLSERVRTSEDPVSLRGEIDTFLDYHVGRLFGEDPSAVAASRAALGDPVGQSSTPAFNRFYAELLADRLLRRFPNAPTFNQLNAAIVTEEVARGTQSTRFGPVITRMAADDDASVAYWAAKAAYPIFPELLQALDGRGREALVTALVGAVQRFPENGALAEEVFRTLSMRTIEPRPPQAEVLAAGAPLIVPAVQDLIVMRVGRYAPNAPAQDPWAEQPGLVVLTNNFVWPSQTDEQKLRTVAVMRDLMLQAVTTANNLPQQGQTRQAIVETVKRVGSAFAGVSGPVQTGGDPQIPAVFPAAQTLYRLGRAPSTSSLESASRALSTALEAAFPGLPPPQLSTRPPQATQPATGPATRTTPE